MHKNEKTNVTSLIFDVEKKFKHLQKGLIPLFLPFLFLLNMKGYEISNPFTRKNSIIFTTYMWSVISWLLRCLS